jgi:hypothetical protein
MTLRSASVISINNVRAERLSTFGLQRYEHRRCSVALQLRRIDHGKRFVGNFLFYAMNPNIAKCLFTAYEGKNDLPQMDGWDVLYGADPTAGKLFFLWRLVGGAPIMPLDGLAKSRFSFISSKVRGFHSQFDLFPFLLLSFVSFTFGDDIQ